MPGGRPSDYDPKFVEAARVACKLGATDPDLAKMFGVAISTVRDWAVRHEEFAAVLKVGKGEPDDRVEKSLYQRAIGYSFEAEKIFLGKDGSPVRVPYIEHIPPDTTAQIFWLKNRRRDEWRDRQEITGKDGGPIETKTSFSFDELTVEQRAAAKQLLDALAQGPGREPEAT